MKILVNLYIPAIDKNYDITIPDDLRLKSITTMLANTVETLSDGLFRASGEEVLCSKEKNMAFKSNETLMHYGVKNGEHLILI